MRPVTHYLLLAFIPFLAGVCLTPSDPVIDLTELLPGWFSGRVAHCLPGSD